VTPVEDLAVGDVITYVPPGESRPLSHRLTSVTHDDTNGLVLSSKCAANVAGDPWKFTLDDRVQAKVVFTVPWAGYPLWVLGSPLSRLLLIGRPASASAGR